ncbi:uncharacterized protein A4U43_C04F17840 [Asparagus officinalis]|uniref:Uncharacterized protein n=1 Tax=Asparagus officinalis TaxID=4686 RepID=A0A5P1F2A6_ASPOF|nr:uncharacterized protein A4U43_C04F17840 [Asparagus officinalis]
MYKAWNGCLAIKRLKRAAVAAYLYHAWNIARNLIIFQNKRTNVDDALNLIKFELKIQCSKVTKMKGSPSNRAWCRHMKIFRTRGRRMKASVILFLGLILISSCFTMSRKLLTHEIQTDEEAGAKQDEAAGPKQELVDNGNSEKSEKVGYNTDTETHHTIPVPAYSPYMNTPPGLGGRKN